MQRFQNYSRNKIILLLAASLSLTLTKGNAFNMDQQDIIKFNQGISELVDTLEIQDQPEIIELNEKPLDSFLAVSSFLNPARNSRTNMSLGNHIWETKWSTSIEDGFIPEHLLIHKNRIIVYGNGNWNLFDDNGKLLNSGLTGISEISIDEAEMQFYFSDINGLIQVRDLNDGSYRHSIFAMYGEDYFRSMILIKDNHLLISSTEFMDDPHGNHTRNHSIIEVQELGNPKTFDKNNYLVSANRLNTISIRSVNVWNAFDNGILVTAVPDHILISDMQLNVKKVLKDKFTPVKMSLDQSGRIYLIVKTISESEQTSTSLWVLTQDGKRIVNAAIVSNDSVTYPPAIGYDGTIFIQFENFVSAYNNEGSMLWNNRTSGETGGAVATADNFLLLSEGNLISALDKTGERKFVFKLDDETLCTPPVLTDKNEIIVASDEKLYCLKIKNK